MDNVTSKKVQSPWTGSWSTEIITEAWWYCPDTGQFITKGIVKRVNSTIPGHKPSL